MRVTKQTVILGLVLFFLSIAGNVTGKNISGSFTLSPMIGGYIFESSQALDDELAYGLGVGYNFNKNWGLEAVFNYIETGWEQDVNGGADVNTTLYHIDALYHFLPDNKLVPYICAGIGSIYLDPDAGYNDMDSLLNYGGGVKYFINEVIALRGEVRHIISFDETQQNFIYSAGFTFSFGGEDDTDGDGVYDNMDRCPHTPTNAVVDNSGCPLDSDRDGVYDYIDRCPHTPTNAAVDNSGCPLDSDRDGVYDYLDRCPDTPTNAAVDNSGCPSDSDRDGVYDYLDRCPDTPTNAAVDNSGCPSDSDSDSDGVYDYLDKCPDTPINAAVDNSGCPSDSDSDGVYDYLDKCQGTPKGATVDSRGCWVIKGVLFDPGKSKIKPSTHKALNNIAAILKQNPTLRLEVQGHTDNRGSLSINKMLSQKRATAVMEYLLGKSIKKDRLTAKGLWFTNPAASNKTRHGRAKNRRVELMPIY